jgi:hypothetical protein
VALGEARLVTALDTEWFHALRDITGHEIQHSARLGCDVGGVEQSAKSRSAWYDPHQPRVVSVGADSE